jgi:hypothetical protein
MDSGVIGRRYAKYHTAHACSEESVHKQSQQIISLNIAVLVAILHEVNEMAA